MRKSRAASLMIVALVVAAAVCFSLSPAEDAVALPQGFTSTFPPPPTNPPPNPKPGPTETPAPVLFDPIITKLVDVDHAQVGDTVHYTLVITNPNPVEIPNVVIVDPLPDVLDYLSATSPQGTVSADGNNLTFNLGTLAPGQELRIVIHARVNSKGQPPNVFINTAHLTWDDGRHVDSNPVSVTIVPASLPATGQGPGLHELANMVAAAVAALGLLGFGLAFVVRRFGRAR
jgi:uncharacterized repeat protein (TIGR01451 family)